MYNRSQFCHSIYKRVLKVQVENCQTSGQILNYKWLQQTKTRLKVRNVKPTLHCIALNKATATDISVLSPMSNFQGLFKFYDRILLKICVVLKTHWG
jgi:hypothetical protein